MVAQLFLQCVVRFELQSLIGRLVITAHTSPYLFFLLRNCTYSGHILENENFLANFTRILSSCVVYKFLGVRHLSRIPSDRLLFDETFAQPCIFAVVNCADVFYSSVLTRCRIFLQLRTALSEETADNNLCSLQ